MQERSTVLSVVDAAEGRCSQSLTSNEDKACQQVSATTTSTPLALADYEAQTHTPRTWEATIELLLRSTM